MRSGDTDQSVHGCDNTYTLEIFSKFYLINSILVNDKCNKTNITKRKLNAYKYTVNNL